MKKELGVPDNAFDDDCYLVYKSQCESVRVAAFDEGPVSNTRVLLNVAGQWFRLDSKEAEQLGAALIHAAWRVGP